MNKILAISFLVFVTLSVAACTDSTTKKQIKIPEPEPIIEPEKICEVDGVTLWKIKNSKYLQEYGSNEYIFFTTGCGKVIDADK